MRRGRGKSIGNGWIGVDDMNTTGDQRRLMAFRECGEPVGLLHVVLAFVIGLFAAPAAWVRAGDLPSYGEVREAMNAAYEARDELLQRSRGTARLFISREAGVADLAGKIEQEMEESLGLDAEGFRICGQGNWTTVWQQSGSRRRYDMSIPAPLEAEPDRRPFLVPTDIRIAVDQEKGIYYSLPEKTAYINKPPSPAVNPYDLTSYFRIERLYQFSGADFPTVLDRWDEAGVVPELSWDLIGQTQCVRLFLNHEQELTDGRRTHSELELWVAPSQSYSPLKAVLRTNWAGKKDRLSVLESYEAAYKESEAFAGIWLLENVRIVDNHGRQGDLSETLEADFEDVEVGVDVPDETFTFEGLGVPPGTPILDKSLGGQPLRYYYGSFPTGQVDHLAEEIGKLSGENSGEANMAAEVASGVEADEGEASRIIGRQGAGRGWGYKEARLFWISLAVLIAAAVAVFVKIHGKYYTRKG